MASPNLGKVSARCYMVSLATPHSASDSAHIVLFSWVHGTAGICHSLPSQCSVTDTTCLVSCIPEQDISQSVWHHQPRTVQHPLSTRQRPLFAPQIVPRMLATALKVQYYMWPTQIHMESKNLTLLKTVVQLDDSIVECSQKRFAHHMPDGLPICCRMTQWVSKCPRQSVFHN